MYKKILLPVSGQQQCRRSGQALRRALLIGDSDCEIVLLHVTEPISQMLGGKEREEVIEENRNQALLLLKPLIDTLDKDGRSYHIRVEAGTPTERIVSVASKEKVDLIIMFTDVVNGITDMLLGTITERVLRNSPVDLLAIRNP